MTFTQTDKDTFLSGFSSRLRDELAIKGETARTLSEGTGIAASNISAYLSGRANGQLSECGIFNIYKIADYLGVSTDYLLGRTPVRAPDPDKALETIRQYTGLSERAIAALHLPCAPLSWWDVIRDERNKTGRCVDYDGFVNNIIETGVLHHTARKANGMENAEDEQSCRLAAFEAVEIFQRFITDRRDEILKKLL